MCIVTLLLHKYQFLNSCSVEDSGHLGSDALSLGECFAVFQRNVVPSSSRVMKLQKNHAPSDTAPITEDLTYQKQWCENSKSWICFISFLCSFTFV